MRLAMLAPPQPVSIRPRAIATWLMSVAGLVFVMIVVGGITRLTESGLSITRWEPVTGAIPPLNEADWQAAFDLYRDSPQYQQVNRGMSLDDFKFIYFWEYIHRLLGRVIGLAFALALLWFAVKRAIPRGYGWKLGVLFVLGGLQGAIGWWMVASGLVDQPEVSHVRLAVHLLMALTIFGALIWVALDLRTLARSPVGAPGAHRPGRHLGAVAAGGADAVRRLCGGAGGGLCLQHLAADGRRVLPRRDAVDGAVPRNLRRQPDRGPVRPPLDGVRGRRRHRRRGLAGLAARPPQCGCDAGGRGDDPDLARHRHHRHGRRAVDRRCAPGHGRLAAGALLLAAHRLGERAA
jgi:hypothetical protein